MTMPEFIRSCIKRARSANGPGMRMGEARTIDFFIPKELGGGKVYVTVKKTYASDLYSYKLNTSYVVAQSPS